jgi:hypothetical protein
MSIALLSIWFVSAVAIYLLVRGADQRRDQQSGIVKTLAGIKRLASN